MKRELITIASVLLALIIGWNLTAYRDIEHLKIVAPNFIEERGYTVTSYDGHTGDCFMGGGTWYQARDKSGLLYSMKVTNWRGELQMYDVKCLNAVTTK